MLTNEEWEQIESAPKYTMEQIGTYLKLHLSADEKLALAYELHHQAGKALTNIYGECHSENTYNKKVAQIQKKAQKILKDDLSWRFQGEPDFIAELGIELH